MTGATQADTYSGGFRQPVFDAQGVFRVALDALARPGRIMPLAARTKPPRPMPPLLADILSALADQDTSVFLCPALLAKAPSAAGWVRFQTGAANVKNPAEADFVVASHPENLPPLSQLSPGTPDYPDRSATVLVAVPGFDGGLPVTLSGPGIKDKIAFSPDGMSRGLWQQLVANHALYPRGIDVIFVAGEAVVGLPRSTRIEIGEV
ncbi:alpha-D-ribose 1-methylphosphonate 5-triphosphate synthase subunit PhnH [Breoghania corrubedonensis]|uniref:Alpha-D-ribose 1-methylphosphonate 5-triphosphate synthase subunit PhnH n=1 Tax=Breoghania corrubedonensis TaxID=665038 RepID=A0A2T5VFF9_9HYPH|nr:phosphonate C-P lyase system protein PhnH [Breoghania corrubedonensis]PTW62484.1 alpha-D-ribose 1-methylphosphonate 5-triphosphate synthase subunit PhnH [Breoghania corrubedonensis]